MSPMLGWDWLWTEAQNVSRKRIAMRFMMMFPIFDICKNTEKLVLLKFFFRTFAIVINQLNHIIMKKIIVALMAILLVGFYSCKKDDGVYSANQRYCSRKKTNHTFLIKGIDWTEETMKKEMARQYKEFQVKSKLVKLEGDFE